VTLVKYGDYECPYCRPAALFEHQTALEEEDLVRFAAELDLDLARFATDLDADTHSSRVREDFRGVVRGGVRGTPTFYLDDVRYDGVIGVRQLTATVRESHPDLVDEGLDAALQQRTIPRVLYERSPFRPPSGLGRGVAPGD
jgi:protein-disulfide isomerase